MSLQKIFTNSTIIHKACKVLVIVVFVYCPLNLLSKHDCEGKINSNQMNQKTVLSQNLMNLFRLNSKMKYYSALYSSAC